jgi:molybdate transport system substrate-binding protein
MQLESRRRHASRRLTGFAAALAIVSTASSIASGEIRVMTSGAFASAHETLSPGFAKRTGETIVTVATSMGLGADAIPSRVRRGEAVDVVILPEAGIDALIENGLILAGTKVTLARSAIGMAVRAGAARPDIGTVEALKRALLAARSVAYSASVSGDYLANVLFPRLGIVEEMKARSRRIERERVGAVVARGEAELGFQQISELLPIPGIAYAPSP